MTATVSVYILFSVVGDGLMAMSFSLFGPFVWTGLACRSAYRKGYLKLLVLNIGVLVLSFWRIFYASSSTWEFFKASSVPLYLYGFGILIVMSWMAALRGRTTPA